MALHVEERARTVGAIGLAFQHEAGSPLQNGIGGGGFRPWRSSCRVPFSRLWGRLNRWNCGTPTPLPLEAGGMRQGPVEPLSKRAVQRQSLS